LIKKAHLLINNVYYEIFECIFLYETMQASCYKLVLYQRA